MKCPECGAQCWRDEVNVGVDVIYNDWFCTECDWDESRSYPMEEYNWQEFLEADDYFENNQK
jgi:hypothetical protein